MSLAPRVRWLHPRRATAVCGLVIAAIVLGCMSLSIGGRTVTNNGADGVLEQEGDVRLSAGQKKTVFYPIAYASPPNLTVKSFFDNESLVLTEQGPTHFTVERQGSGIKAVKVKWTAKGVRAANAAPPVIQSPPTQAPLVPPPVLPPAGVVAPAPLPPGLPSRPIPIEGGKP